MTSSYTKVLVLAPLGRTSEESSSVDQKVVLCIKGCEDLYQLCLTEEDIARSD